MKTIAVIDLGTNSIRLAVVRIDPQNHWTPLAMLKETIRLGEGEFAHNRLTRSAMERGLIVLSKFVEIAREHNPDELIAVATAAVREANNRDEFIERAREMCGIDLQVVSGMEEARLIYLGVASGIELGDERGLFIDIGGGTTEMIIGSANEHLMLESVKLGAVRLANMFLAGDKGPVSKKKYNQMLDYVRDSAMHTFRKIEEYGFHRAYGSSGTIMNLAEITARRIHGDIGTVRNYVLKYPDLVETAKILSSLNLSQRKKLPGINPERADIIVCGAAILEGVMSGANVNNIIVSDLALREGVIVDFLMRNKRVGVEYLADSPRMRSVRRLAAACQFEEKHANKAAELSVSIFNQLGKLGLHMYGDEERELLEYAAIMHDIGIFISYIDHHKHTYYLIRNSDMLGFTDEEIEIVATVAMCHRKTTPRKIANKKLSDVKLRLAEALASILRIADALDRSQLSLVNKVAIIPDPAHKQLIFEIRPNKSCPLEMWAFENKKSLFEQVFGVAAVAKSVEGQLSIGNLNSK